MPVHIELTQTRTIEPDNKYRVLNEVTYATGIAKEVFVFEVATDEFSHVAYPYDMIYVPASKQEAIDGGNNYYRQDNVTRDYDSVAAAAAFAAHSRGRVEFLAVEYERATEDFAGSDDYVYES